MNKNEKNDNGLTFQQWLAAAGYRSGWNQEHIQCWKDGEDPSDHRLENDNAEYERYARKDANLKADAQRYN